MDTSTPVILVTGASRGLGRGIALRLAELGFSVAINYAGNRAAATETATACASRAPSGAQRFIPLKCDVGSEAERESLVNDTLGQFGRIDALVNNAGMGPRVRSDITEATVGSFREVVATNLEGPYFLTQSVVRYWLREKPRPLLKRGFTVIFNTSISALTASLNRGEYCVSKAGLSMGAHLWALRLAGEGIGVFELRPGIMATDMTAGVKEKYDAMIASGAVPMRRWGTPEDVGSAVGSILSGDFPYSTGEIIYIDGGLHLPRL
ncbi:MAG TPA: 3-ketoacyl-ACP reductase [Bacteroidota bacterium]|nr:3-ketoacyl-ACP reductase [Bacteroidota bacterium]